jgi:phosphoribosylglycinamide formyltransferase 1
LGDTKNILFLASGRGSNFQSFVDHLRLHVLKNIEIRGLICNHSGALVIQRAKAANIASFEMEGIAGKKFESSDKRDLARLAFDNECISISKSLNSDYLVLAGFDQILTKAFIDNFPYRILNIHPAYDLKRFGGRMMIGSKVHEMVLAQKAKYSGCSVHLVTPAVDQGPVIIKKRVEVLPSDDPTSLESRILEQEHLAYPEALQLLVDGRVIISDSLGARCFVDRHSDDWDVEWSTRQQSYIDYVKNHNSD